MYRCMCTCVHKICVAFLKVVEYILSVLTTKICQVNMYWLAQFSSTYAYFKSYTINVGFFFLFIKTEKNLNEPKYLQ